MQKLGDFLAINRNILILLAAIVLIGAGEETWMRFVPKYLETMGASALLIGAFDAVKTLLGAVYAFPGGVLADRWGHRRAFVTFTVISIAGYALMIAAGRPSTVIVAMFLFLAWSDLSLPATFSLVAEELPKTKHAMGIGMQSLVRRIPIVVGPIVGGILIDRFGMRAGVRIGVSISIVMALVTLGLQARMRFGWRENTAGMHLVRTLRSFPAELRRLLFSDILIRFCERLPFAWIVIYAMAQGATATEVGFLTAIEMAAAIACYIPVAYLADRFGKEPFVVMTFLMFTVFPLALAASHTFSGLAVAFAIRGLKEFGEPARKSLIVNYASPSGRGQGVGAYYLVRDTVVMLGSFLGAALWSIDPKWNLLSAAALGALGTVVYVATSPTFSLRMERR